MSIALTEEQQMLRGTIRRFMEHECPKSLIRELDERDEFPRALFDKLSALGLTGLTIPEQYGGAGRQILSAVIVGEEISRRYAALAWVFGMCLWYGGEDIRKIGNGEQRLRYLPKLAQGQLLFSYALTEPQAGSDLSAIQATATRQLNGYVLNGTKTFITGADQADFMTTLVRTAGSPPDREGLSMFIVDMRSKGITCRPIKKLGYKGSSACEVFMEDVLVSAENLIGGEDNLNRGWEQMLQTLETERIAVALSGLGVAQGALDESTEYAKSRVQFGKPISKLQAIRHMLADMAVAVEMARLATYHAAALLDQDRPCALECNMAKLYATETAKRVALDGLQIVGGHGYSLELDIQRYVRDALVLTIGGGTSQVLRNIIAGQLGL